MVVVFGGIGYLLVRAGVRVGFYHEEHEGHEGWNLMNCRGR